MAETKRIILRNPESADVSRAVELAMVCPCEITLRRDLVDLLAPAGTDLAAAREARGPARKARRRATK